MREEKEKVGLIKEEITYKRERNSIGRTGEIRVEKRRNKKEEIGTLR